MSESPAGPEPAPGPPVHLERDLTAYYDQEADDRAGRALGDRRLASRTAFLSGLAPGRHVLEIGPGAGRDSAALADAGHHVVGVDLSYQQLRHAGAAGASPVVATARALPFHDDSFDALWTMSVLMHVPNSAIEATLRDLRRVMVPGARAAIGVWGGPDVETRGDKDRFDPPRLFSRRSDARWQSLLTHLGTVVEFANWEPDADDFWYQWAVVDVGG